MRSIDLTLKQVLHLFGASLCAASVLYGFVYLWLLAGGVN